MNTVGDGLLNTAVMTLCLAFGFDDLNLIDAAALVRAVERSTHFGSLRTGKGQTILINGGRAIVDFMASQIALLRGVHVIAPAGDNSRADCEISVQRSRRMAT